MIKKLLVGITQDNELYFLEIDTTNGKRNGYNEFTMSGFTVRPITREDAITQCKEMLDEDQWKQAVEANSTTLGLNDWIKYVIDSDGELVGFDNSLFNNEVEVDGIDYLFSSESCGQHEEDDLKHYFINSNLFKQLMKIWKQYHMKELPENSALSIVEETKEIKQDFDLLAIEAVKIINQ